MADEKDTEASRLNRLSVEGPTNDDDDGGRPPPPPICGRPMPPPLCTGVAKWGYFRATPLEVSYDSAYGESDNYDGGRPPPTWPPFYCGMPPPCGYFDPVNEEHKEFGRDTNRLDYFRVSPLEVSYDSAYGESDNYGGGTSHTGQQESAPTINFDISDLRPTDGNVLLQEETIPNIGLGTIENDHAENTDIEQDNDTTTDLSNCIIWLGIFGLVFCFYGLI